MRNRFALAYLLCCYLLMVTAAHATDLSEVYQQALTADPTLQQASFTYQAAHEGKTQAWLNMLPFNAYASKSWSGVSGPGAAESAGPGVASPSANIPATANVELQSNLFSWSNWIALKQADHTVAQAEATYRAAQEDLISRVAQHYFAVLSAQDDLEAQQSGLASSQRQLDLSEKRYEIGLVAVTEVQTARAQRDTYSAAVIAGKRSVLSAIDQLRAITDQTYGSLSAPVDDLPLLTPDPASEDEWVTTALSQNPGLLANQLAAEIAHDSYLSAIGGHLPQISVQASRAWALQSNSAAGVQTLTGINGQQELDTRDILWQVSITVPLFSAGATQSKVRQAHLLWQASKSAYDAQLRSTQELARDAYQGVISQIAQVQALKQAVASNRVALSATEAGYEVGTKNSIDVLTARQQYVQSQSSYADARYAYLNNIVSLRLAAGSLDQRTIEQLNGWLMATTTPAASTPAAMP